MMVEQDLDQALLSLDKAIKECRICVDSPIQKSPLPHAPRPVAVLSRKARILIAGQAPGLRVHETGIPFNDASGDRLRTWLGVTREDFYNPEKFAILPMGFCFPGYDKKGSDLPPRKECAPNWRADALRLMPQVDLVLAVGTYAHEWHLPGLKGTMTQTVSRWSDILENSLVPQILPLPHPSWRNTHWLKKNPWFEADVLPILKRLVRDRLF